MYLGSDDIVNNKFFEMVVSGAIGYDMYGVLDCYIYEVKSKTLAYWPGYNNQRKGETLGMGRILSRNLLEKLKWQPWISQLDKGMDWSMMQKVKKFKIKSGGMFMRNGMFAVDIKTPVNICSLGNYKNIKRVNVSLLKKLPEYERITRL